MRVAKLLKALRHGEESKVGGLAIGNLMPVKRHGNAGVGKGPYRISRACGSVLRILVVVKKNSVPLLLPPFRTGEGGDAPLDRPRERNRGSAHLGKGPARLNAHVHMHAAGT